MIRRRPLRMWLRAVAWDLRLQVRYHIVTVAAVVAALYGVLFQMVPAAAGDRPLAFILFADPSVLGFLFIGVLVFFERGAHTLQAVVVTPLSSSQYLWSKATSLTLVGTLSGYAVAMAGRGVAFGHAALLAALVLSSLLFVFLGVVGAARARSVNEYLLIVPVFLTPLNVPLLGLAGVADTAAFYLLPTHAALILFRAAFEARPAWEIVYATLYLTASVGAASVWARRSFDRSIRQPGKPR